LDYLTDLGVNALYLNPIFEAASNHRYNTTDYYQIDRRLGGAEDWSALLEAAHRRGFHVVLDGVFNHCGRGFFAFNDLMEREAHSSYQDWFHVQRFPLDAYGPGKAETYHAWWDFKSLPKFNTSQPEVRRYLLAVARHWIEQGADGWRLDVPNEIDDDSFWAEFRAEVKEVNPDAYLVGEIWEADPRWVGENHFDGLMLYPLRKLLLDFVATGTLPATQFLDQVAALTRKFPKGFRDSHYLPLGSHDTERIRTLCAGESQRVRLAALIQFAFPGAPAVYYGDEIGLEGGADPDSRRAFSWQESGWDADLRSSIQGLIRARSKTPALRRGDIVPLFADDGRRLCAFVRRSEGHVAVVVANASSDSQSFDLSLSEAGWRPETPVTDVISGVRYPVARGRTRISLGPWGGLILVPSESTASGTLSQV
jgi:glycosidase